MKRRKEGGEERMAVLLFCPLVRNYLVSEVCVYICDPLGWSCSLCAD